MTLPRYDLPSALTKVKGVVHASMAEYKSGNIPTGWANRNAGARIVCQEVLSDIEANGQLYRDSLGADFEQLRTEFSGACNDLTRISLQISTRLMDEALEANRREGKYR